LLASATVQSLFNQLNYLNNLAVHMDDAHKKAASITSRIQRVHDMLDDVCDKLGMDENTPT